MPEPTGSRYGTRLATGNGPASRRVNYAEKSDDSGNDSDSTAQTEHRVFSNDMNIRHRGRIHPTPHLYFRKQDLQHALKDSTIPLLAPIRIDLECDGQIIREAFLWNINERLYSMEHFLRILCDDLELNPHVYMPLLLESMHHQIEEFRAYHQVAMQDNMSSIERLPISLDIHIGRYYLRDRFEWDIGSNLTPEEFAQKLAQDFNLGGEFVSSIAFSIREQFYQHLKLRINGLTSSDFAMPLSRVYAIRGSIIRDDETSKEWQPTLDVMDDNELERFMVDREREVRRLRRETARYRSSTTTSGGGRATRTSAAAGGLYTRFR